MLTCQNCCVCVCSYVFAADDAGQGFWTSKKAMADAMDTAQDSSSGSGSGVADNAVVEEQAKATSTILVHPMVILTISDHHTRMRMNFDVEQQDCWGKFTLNQCV